MRQPSVPGRGLSRWRPGWTTAVLTLVAGVVASVTAATPAMASHSATPMHWHPKSMTYSLTDTIPTAWRTPLANARNTWNAVGSLQLTQGADIAYTVNLEEDPSSHVVWYGAIPPEWAFGCPPVTILACVRWTPSDPSQSGYPHLSDTDMVWNALFTPLFTNNCLPHPPNPGRTTNVDVETLGLHEFGHFAVLKDLHESSDWGYVMYGQYNGCQRSLTSDDIAALQAAYTGH